MAEKQISEAVGAPESQDFCWHPEFETYLSILSLPLHLDKLAMGMASHRPCCPSQRL